MGKFMLLKDQIGERIAARDAERQDKKKERLNDVNPEEDVHNFYNVFMQKLTDLKATLTAIDDESKGLEPSEITARFGQLASDTQAARDFFNGGSHHLPAFDQRSMQMKLQKFDEETSSVESRLIPRKKFAFGKRKEKKKPGVGNVIAAEAGSRHSDAAAAKEGTKIAAEMLQVVKNPEQLLTGRKWEIIVVDSAKLAGKDLFIHQCEGCTILLLGRMGALRMEHVRDCTVLSGPVAGGCHIESAEGTTFHLAAHQLRL